PVTTCSERGMRVILTAGRVCERSLSISVSSEDLAVRHVSRARINPVWIDVAIVILLGVGAAIGGLSYWKRATASGQPFYYQNYFEPAVMVACGRGYVVARPQVPAMVPFLWRQTDRFSCDSIPRDAPLGTQDIYQLGSWRYLL